MTSKGEIKTNKTSPTSRCIRQLTASESQRSHAKTPLRYSTVARAAVELYVRKKMKTIIKLFSFLYALQITSLLGGEVMLVHRFSIDGAIPSIEEARELFSAKKADEFQTYNVPVKVGVEGGKKFTYGLPQEKDKAAMKPGISLSGKFFTLPRGRVRMRLAFNEVKIIGFMEDRTPRFSRCAIECNPLSDNEGYAVVTLSESGGIVEILLIHIRDNSNPVSTSL